MMQAASRINYQLCRSIARTSVNNIQTASACYTINRYKSTNQKKNQQQALKLDPKKKYECPPPPPKPVSAASSSSNNQPPPKDNNQKILIAAAGVASLGAIFYYFNRRKKGDEGKVESAEKKTPEKYRSPISGKDIPKHIPYILIGGGTASFAAFRAIKSNEPRAKILVISNEDSMPYMRPPLSKEIWFDAKLALEEGRFKQWNGQTRSLFYEPDEFYMPVEKLDESKNGGVSVIRGYNVTKLNLSDQKVLLDDGTEITYDKCLIATGSVPKTLDVFNRAPAKVREKIFTFKTYKDFQIIKEKVENAKSIAVVGNGLLGSELACALAHYGEEKKLKVYQLFPESGNMAKILPNYLANWTTNRIKDVGVDVMPHSQIVSAEIFEGKQVKLNLSNGKNIIADLVLQAIGSEPNIELAKDAMLEIDKILGGFVVNAELEARTNLFAAGDVACFYDPRFGRRRVEHHDHAVVSGRLAGDNMVGQKKPYKHQSMFWSDLGSAVGYEAIGLIDSSFPTVGIFAKQNDLDKLEKHLALDESGKEEKSESSEGNARVIIDGENCETTPDPERFDKGVIFYMQNDKIVGILLWNVFNRISIARRILSSDEKFTDLNEVAKLFDIFDQHHEEKEAKDEK